MVKAKIGDRVQVLLKGRLEDGTIFSDQYEKKPIEFTIGENNLINGIEMSIVGMEESESRSIKVPPEEAYGHYQKQLISTINLSQVSNTITPKLGMGLQLKYSNGRSVNARIVDISNSKIVVDANHALAGKTCVFDLKLFKILS